jgi:hydrophobe/amphiphile efflux-3 (HAE3) family protein
LFRRTLEKLAKFIRRRAWWLIAAIVVISAAVAPGITMIETESGFNALVSSGSQIFEDNARYEEQFGDEPITILLSGQLDDIFSSDNLAILDEFEQEFSQDERYQSILSPTTVLQLAAAEIFQARQELEAELLLAQEAAAEQARQAAITQGLSLAEQEQAAQQAKAQVLQQYQPFIDELYVMGEPSLDNPVFISLVIYNSDGSISDGISSLVPDDQHALIIVTPIGNLEDEDALQVAEDVEWFFRTHPLDSVATTVISDAKLIEAISESITSSITLLLALSIGTMMLILMLLFRVRWRMLSLLIVGVGALWVFSLMGYVSVPLSMATMAVLPILFGLGIDYSIQFHNRYQEEITRSSSVAEAVVTSISSIFPAVAIALVATIIGFITLFISAVPMVQDFGLVLAVGILLCFLLALFLLHSIMYLGDRRIPIAKLGRASVAASGRMERILSWVARVALKNPLPILLIALAVGIAGGVLDQQLPSNSDYEQLMPQDIDELQQLRQLRGIVGYGGEIKFMIEADDVTDPSLLQWLKEFQDEEMALYPEVISVDGPAALISQASGGIIPDRQQIDQILEDTPEVYINRVISDDRTMANISFGIEYASLEQVHDLLDLIEQDAQPPDGVSIAPVGTLALGANTVDAVTGNRLTMNLICLGAIFVVLLLVYRRLSSAIFCVITVGMVIAWTSFDLYMLGIPLNPLTAIMGVIIIGIGTEFMVLLLGRYEEEKQKGLLPKDAMIVAISKIGRAIVITALTTLGGFGILIISNFVMIRDFGIATVLSVLLCLISTITVMPPLIVWLDERIARRLAK